MDEQKERPTLRELRKRIEGGSNSESDRIADEHLAVARRAVALLRPRRVKRARVAWGVSRRPRETAGQPSQFFPTIAEAYATVCRRAECRRAFACLFGTRAGETPPAEDARPPCWDKLPRAVTLALPLALQRKFHPDLFDDPFAMKREAEAMRVARTSLAALETAARKPPAPRAEAPTRPAPQAAHASTGADATLLPITKTPLAPDRIPAHSPEPRPRCRML